MAKPRTLVKSPEVSRRRDRLAAICAALPEVEVSGDEHLTFRVGKKVFAYYVFDHHGDGKIALWCNAPFEEQGRLVQRNPRRFFVPPYVGPKGWVALRLDLPSVNWNEVKKLVTIAHWLTAPAKLRKRLEG